MNLNTINRKALLIFIFLSFFSYTLIAQVNGKVIDSSGVAVPFVYIGLANSSDTALIKITIADEKGNYSIEAEKAGTFRLIVSAVGFEKYFSAPFVLSAGHWAYKAPDIILKSEAHLLNSIQVVSQRPFMEQKIDRTVYNIQNSIISSGNNVLDILGKLPGVMVDNSEAISVRGKSGVLIMIDGKTNYLSAQDAATYLKSLEASQVDKIEVITNPSSKYDAAGNAIINIILKKDKNLGLNATVVSSYRQDFYGTGYGGIDVNYRMKKINFFGNGYYSSTGFFHDINQTNTFNLSATPEILTDDEHITFRGNGISGKIGADYAPNDKQTLGFSIEGENEEANRVYTTQSNSYNGNVLPDSSVSTLGGKYDTYTYRDYNLNYKFKIDSSGRELDANADYVTVVINQTINETSYYYDSLGRYMRPPNSIQSSPPYNTGIKVINTDYTQPLGKYQKLEMGLKYSSVTNNNNNQFWNVVNGAYILDSSKSNHFILTEQLAAGYLNYSRKLNNKLDVEIGLRGEETLDKGTYVNSDSIFYKKYFNLFPTAFFNWKVDSNQSINISYSRRIDRPGFFSLDPYVFYVSPYFYDLGNPLLQPEFSNNIEVTHLFKTFLSTGIGYTYSTNVFTSVSLQNTVTHITYMIPVNMSNGAIFNILCSATIPVTKRITSITSLNGYHNQYSNSASSGGFNVSGYSWTINSTNSINLGKKWSAEIVLNYNSQSNYGYWLYKPVYILDAGVKKNFAHDSGTITLNFSDLFWSNKTVATEIYQNENIQTTDYRDSRGARVTLSWKLGKSQYENPEKKKASNEEINRVKS